MNIVKRLLKFLSTPVGDLFKLKVTAKDILEHHLCSIKKSHEKVVNEANIKLLITALRNAKVKQEFKKFEILSSQPIANYASVGTVEDNKIISLTAGGVLLRAISKLDPRVKYSFSSLGNIVQYAYKSEHRGHESVSTVNLLDEFVGIHDSLDLLEVTTKNGKTISFRLAASSAKKYNFKKLADGLERRYLS